MWEIVENLAYLVLFVMFLMTFWSQQSRDRFWSWVGQTWRETWTAISPMLYKLITGSVPDRVKQRYIIVKEADEGDDEEDDFAPAATTATTQQQPIAMPQNDSNALLLHAKAEALAAMVKAGKIGETDGIKTVFGEKPSSTNPRYLAARDALKQALAELEPGPRVLSEDGTLKPMTHPITKGLN